MNESLVRKKMPEAIHCISESHIDSLINYNKNLLSKRIFKNLKYQIARKIFYWTAEMSTSSHIFIGIQLNILNDMEIRIMELFKCH
jgi:hypothetical protein